MNNIDIKNWEKKFDGKDRKVYAWVGDKKNMKEKGFPYYVEFNKHTIYREDVPHLELGDSFWVADFLREPWEGSGLELEAGRVAWGKDKDAVKEKLKEWMKENSVNPQIPSQKLEFSESTFVNNKNKKKLDEVA